MGVSVTCPVSRGGIDVGLLDATNANVDIVSRSCSEDFRDSKVD
jgi:hypothetical protein